MKHSSVSRKSRAQMTSSGSVLPFFLSVYLGVSLMILLSSIFYSRESQLQSPESPGLLSYSFEWTAVNIHFYWSPHQIHVQLWLPLINFIFRYLNQPFWAKWNAMLRWTGLKHLFHINKTGFDWRRDYFLRENQVLREEELILGKKTLTI